MAETYDVYFGTSPDSLTLFSEDQANLSFTVAGVSGGSPFNYISTYYWRVDATNESGTTEGNVWSFTTIRFSYPAPVYHYSTEDFYYYLLPDGSPPPIGVEGTDYVIVYNPNFIRTTRRLICATKDSIFYGET